MQNPPKTSAPLLSFDHVMKDYTNAGERVRALDSVSLEIGSGRFVAFVGRSGCGKSTLLHLAGALDFPTAGHVRLDGVATDELSEAGLTKLRRENIGFVFQSFQLLNTLSVVENVEIPLLLAGEDDARPRAMERLADVGLAKLAQRMTHQLSGGQMQRVAIARALVHAPRVILADEPTSNLDTATGNAILELLQRVCSEQAVTILMATHSAEASGRLQSVSTETARCKSVFGERNAFGDLISIPQRAILLVQQDQVSLRRASGGAARLLQQREPYEAHHFGLWKQLDGDADRCPDQTSSSAGRAMRRSSTLPSFLTPTSSNWLVRSPFFTSSSRISAKSCRWRWKFRPKGASTHTRPA